MALIIRRASPHFRLSSIVRHYQSRSGEITDQIRVPLPARTEVLLEFYFSEPHLLELQSTAKFERAPWVVAVGPQTFRRVDLLLLGKLDIFTVHLTATGLYRLTGIPMPEITNAGIDAAAMFGPQTIARLQDRLAAAHDLAGRVRIADALLLELLASEAARSRAIAVSRLRAVRSTFESARFDPASAGMSERHYRRLFEQQVGIAPKRYARIIRLEEAIAAKGFAPERSWTDIAHDCGYFDQAHMDKDFLALAGVPPSKYVIRPSAP